MERLQLDAGAPFEDGVNPSRKDVVDLLKSSFGSMLLKNSRNLIFDSGGIHDAVVAQAAPYGL
jgi:hypothetical protein